MPLAFVEVADAACVAELDADGESFVEVAALLPATGVDEFETDELDEGEPPVDALVAVSLRFADVDVAGEELPGDEAVAEVELEGVSLLLAPPDVLSPLLDDEVGVTDAVVGEELPVDGDAAEEPEFVDDELSLAAPELPDGDESEEFDDGTVGEGLAVDADSVGG